MISHISVMFLNSELLILYLQEKKKKKSHDLALTLLEDTKLKITQWKNHAIS